MKKVHLIFTILVLFTSSISFSQQLMQTVKDAHIIKANQEQFINKPLKELLKEIKPQIKRVTASPSKNIQTSVGYLIFNFVNEKQKDSLRSKNEIPVTIVVYVKEYFEWDFQKRPKGNETVWTASDAKKFGDLTIVGFRVYGETTIPN
jgi:hypothetical protein